MFYQFIIIFSYLLLQLIMVPGYTQEEKIAISKRHLLPKQLKVSVTKTAVKIYFAYFEWPLPLLACRNRRHFDAPIMLYK